MGQAPERPQLDQCSLTGGRHHSCYEELSFGCALLYKEPLHFLGAPCHYFVLVLFLFFGWSTPLSNHLLIYLVTSTDSSFLLTDTGMGGKIRLKLIWNHRVGNENLCGESILLIYFLSFVFLDGENRAVLCRKRHVGE